MTFRNQEKFWGQTLLVLESIAILFLCFLLGVLVPDGFAIRIREIISHSILFDNMDRLRYAIVATIIFLIIHQHLCWGWMINASRKYFADANYGKVIFFYGCGGLVFFSVVFILYQIV